MSMTFEQWSGSVNAQLGQYQREIQRLQQANQQISQEHARMLGVMQATQDTLKSVKMSRSNTGALLRNVYAKAWGGEGYVSLDDIEGRLIPYDYLVAIPVPSGSANQLSQSINISMEGPFVATHRVLAFQSLVTFEVTDANGSKAAFLGRSNGRFRSISSAQDFFDAARAFEQVSQYQPAYLGAVYDGADILAVGNPMGVNMGSNASSLVNALPNFPGNDRPIVVSPLSMAASRTMGFDGVISVELAGANFRRQNIDVPSDFWQEGVTGSTQLSVYDVFDAGETVTFKVTPSHVSNPAYGNISDLFRNLADYALPDPATGITANNPIPEGPWPFLAGQFDGHEGINAWSPPESEADATDPAVRVFTGVLFIGFRGFRILTPPAPPPKK